MKKSLLLATGVLAFVSLPLAHARSYELIFGNPVQAGTVELNQGAYAIRQKGDCAIFTNVETGRTYKVMAKVVNLDHKNKTTTIMMNNNQIERLAVGGHASELQFTY
jgi:hypothetical protein